MTITIDQIVKEYPALKKFENNPDAVMKMYQQLHAAKNLRPGTLGDGVKVNGAELLILQVNWEFDRPSCPEKGCYKSIKADIGTLATCPKCGQQVEVTAFHTVRMMVGDEFGMAFLDFSPLGFKLEGADKYVGKVVQVRGVVKGVGKTKKQIDGKLTDVEYPVISVKDMKVISDVAQVGSDSIEAFEQKAAEAPVEVKPEPQVITTIPEDKLRAFKLWMGILKTVKKEMATDRASQLGLSYEDIKPFLVESVEQDGQVRVTLVPIA